MNEKPHRSPSAPGLARVALVATTTLAAIAPAGVLPAVADAQSAGDTAAIRARIEDYRRVWNTHDASALATLFAPDADLAMGNLPAASGRQQIDDSWREYFARQEPQRHLTLDLRSLRFIAADVAAVTVVTTTGSDARAGEKLPARRFRGTWLMQRQGGNWLIVAMRGLPLQEDSVVLNASVGAAERLRPQIRGFVAAYEDALNTHDASAVSGFYGNDAEIIIRDSPLVRGREAIQAWWRTYFSQPRRYRAILITDAIRMITPDVALINLTATGAVEHPEGAPAPVRYARATWVIVRLGGEWRISALWILPSEDDAIIRRSGGPT